MKIREFIHNFLLNHPYLNPYGFTWDRLIRNITADFRILPDFFIIGCHKSGTTSLYSYLAQLTNIGEASRKEIQYFSMSYWRGLRWYKSHFPLILTKKRIEKDTGIKFITGEATPFYIFHPLSIQRIYNILPHAKIIILLRNPIDRAYSHYQHKRRSKAEPCDIFEDALKEDESRFKIIWQKFKENNLKEYEQKFYPLPYLSMGKYVIYIKELFKIFPRNQCLILLDTDLDNDTEYIFKKVLDFLGLESKEHVSFKKINIGKYEKIQSETRQKLVDYYRPYNKELEELLKVDLGWDK